MPTVQPPLTTAQPSCGKCAKCRCKQREARTTEHPVTEYPPPPSTRAPLDTPLNVIALTIFVGLLLVGFFAIIWFASSCDPRQFSERDALLPPGA
jgi:hypothetical protein